MLSGPTDCRSDEKARRQESKLADKGTYTDISGRRPQARLTQEAKISSDFFLIRAIFAFAALVCALKRRGLFPAAVPIKIGHTPAEPYGK